MKRYAFVVADICVGISEMNVALYVAGPGAGPSTLELLNIRVPNTAPPSLSLLCVCLFSSVIEIWWEKERKSRAITAIKRLVLLSKEYNPQYSELNHNSAYLKHFNESLSKD